jgi:UDP-N-acetylmuramoyl-L-alanyl-D-glutamate--2,6-diaminopimelate ligase
MDLRTLLTGVDAPSVVGDTARQITGIAYHTRDVRPGFLFAALRGFVHDGLAFVDEAIGRGAIAILADRELAPAGGRGRLVSEGVTLIRVADARRALAQISAAFYQHPSQRLRLIGVTGNNGKGATTYLIEAILRRAGRRCGIIGTMGVVIDGQVYPSERTTPEAPDFQRVLRTMADQGCDYVATEVASHALVLERVSGCRVGVGVFTNLTRDHLDFHLSMEAYRAAKARLFSMVEPSGWAVLNADDPAAVVMRAATRARVMTYGLSPSAEVRGSDLTLHQRGSEFVAHTPAGTARIALRLTGAFNVANALAALAVGLTQEVPLPTIAEALSEMPGIPGRFESVEEGQPFAVVVDYAHTPDGLENVLRAAREITAGRLIAVFGCGGDRDRTKRPMMGRIAAEWADHVIVTSDNPRTEDPRAIIDEIRPGVDDGRAGRDVRVEIEPDRRRAIGVAVSSAGAGDLVLIAGKGHEPYQEIGGVRHPFDDRQVVREALRDMLASRPRQPGHAAVHSQGLS